jgi:hypothetical protein
MPGERGGLLSAEGILSITVGAAQVIIGGIITVISGFNISLWLPSLPYFGDQLSIIGTIPTVAVIIGVSVIVLGIIAIIGDEKKQVRTSSNWRYLCPAISHPGDAGSYLCVFGEGRV